MRYLSILLLTFLLGICFMVPQALGEPDSSVTILTLQQAIDLALQHDINLQNANLEVDKTEKQREIAAEVINFTPLMGSSYDEATQENWMNLLYADLAWRKSKKTLEANRDSLVLRTCKSYWDVQTAQEEVALKEKLEQQALVNLQKARAGAMAGTVSEYDLMGIENQWQQARNNVKLAKQALDDTYSSFNDLIGLDANDRPVLSDKPIFEPLKIDNLDYEIQRVIAESPSVWLAQQQVTLKKWAYDMVYSSGSYTPYKVRQIELEQAELNAASAEEAIAQVTRSLYYQIKNVEENYNTALEALKVAEEQLRIAKVKYDVGMATKSDVIAAEVAVAQAQQTINDLVRNHAYLKLAFAKPWAASGGSSSSSVSNATQEK
ncbi:hypothetical protein MHOCP_23390 [Moorella humiferrea]|uniref:TolC family protein n=1 Tax=Neomoorella humiferrea TaxID=676965 RepID=UPI0030CC8FBC